MAPDALVSLKHLLIVVEYFMLYKYVLENANSPQSEQGNQLIFIQDYHP
jgi:hypothetical protein